MAVDDIVGMHIVGRYQEQNVVNTMHFKITAQSSDEDVILANLANQWLSDHATAWLTRHIDSYRLVGIKTFSLSGANKIPGIVSDGTVGSVVGTEIPSPVCRTITLYTDSANFRRRGRLMLSGSETLQFNVGDGAVTAVEIALMETLGVALIQDVTMGADTFSPGLKPVGVLPFEPFTGVLGRKTPSIIRSRRIRGFAIG